MVDSYKQNDLRRSSGVVPGFLIVLVIIKNSEDSRGGDG